MREEIIKNNTEIVSAHNAAQNAFHESHAGDHLIKITEIIFKNTESQLSFFKFFLAQMSAHEEFENARVLADQARIEAEMARIQAEREAFEAAHAQNMTQKLSIEAAEREAQAEAHRLWEIDHELSMKGWVLFLSGNKIILVLNRYTALWRLGATQILALEFLRSLAEENQLFFYFRSPSIDSRS